MDILFELPYATYQRFQQRTGNKQSQLLAEVRSYLAKSYASTRMRADGQVIVVPFVSYAVEVVPAFVRTGGGYLICNTSGGGSYTHFDPVAEANKITASNIASKGNTRDLIRMAKCWQGQCNVPIKSFHIELLAVEFLKGWQYVGSSETYYDWMSRDFFSYLARMGTKYLWVAGSQKIEVISNARFKSRAETAFTRAAKACDHELAERPYLAGEEWQKIFGTFIPVS